jgi:NitT/TauT family transport system substrate-binding protein
MVRRPRLLYRGPMLATVLLLGACSGQQAAPTATPAATTTGQLDESAAAIGVPELTELVVAIPYSHALTEQDYFIAREEGYIADAGLSIEVIPADDVRAAVASGSVDVGTVNGGEAIQAIQQGLAIEIIGGHRCREGYRFAVQPGINTVDDLAGKDVAVRASAGDPGGDLRKRVLAEAGWDLDSVDANEVYVGGGDTLPFFLADRVALIPYYSEDVPQLEDHGANLIVSEIEPWVNDVYIARRGWAEENPNTVAQFLRVVMRSFQFLLAPGAGMAPQNKEQILEYYRQNGFDDDATDAEADSSPYVFGTEEICPNLYFDEAAWDLEVENELPGVDMTVPFDAGTDLTALGRAQQAMGLDNSPPPEIPWPPPSD